MSTEHLPSPQDGVKGMVPEVNAPSEPAPSAAPVLAFLASACAVIAGTLTFLIVLGTGASILVALPVIAWAVAPYVALGVVSWRANESLAGATVAFIGSLLLGDN